MSAVAAATHGGAATFWGLPSPDAIAAVRSLPHPGYGFPERSRERRGGVRPRHGRLLRLPARRHARPAVAARHGPVADVPRPSLPRRTCWVGWRSAASPLGARRCSCGDSTGIREGRLPARLRLPRRVTALLACLVPWVCALDPAYVGRLAGVAPAYGMLHVRGFPPDTGSLARRFLRVVAPAAVLLVASRVEPRSSAPRAGKSGGSRSYSWTRSSCC